MKNTPHIAIIGGGLIGLSTADSLIARDVRVTVFEKGAETGHGAGRYNSGMIHPSQVKPWLYDADLEMIRDLLRWANISRDLLMQRREMLECEDLGRSSGTLQIFDNPDAKQKALNFYTESGVPCREYSGDWTFGCYGLEFPEDQSGNAHHYCLKLRKDLERRGCEFRTNSPAAVEQQGGIISVKTPKSVKAFDHVIVAAGAASADVLKPLGYDLPVSPLRGHALVFDRPDTSLPECPVMHAASHSALTVFDDHVRLSGTVNKEQPKSLLNIWTDISPALVKALGDPVVEWSADRPWSEIGRPVIGSTNVPNLWVNSGHGHMGWSLCAWSGEHLAEMILKTA